MLTHTETLTVLPAGEQSTAHTQRRSRRVAAFGGALAASLLAAACSFQPGEGTPVGRAPSAEATSVATKSPAPGDATPRPGASILLKDSHHPETQQFGAQTFTDYEHAYGPGPRLPVGAVVDVDCLATGPEAAAPSVHGKWYHLTGPDPYTGYYAAANTFVNGDASGPLSEQPPVDPAVPNCP